MGSISLPLESGSATDCLTVFGLVCIVVCFFVCLLACVMCLIFSTHRVMHIVYMGLCLFIVYTLVVLVFLSPDSHILQSSLIPRELPHLKALPSVCTKHTPTLLSGLTYGLPSISPLGTSQSPSSAVTHTSHSTYLPVTLITLCFPY